VAHVVVERAQLRRRRQLQAQDAAAREPDRRVAHRIQRQVLRLAAARPGQHAPGGQLPHVRHARLVGQLLEERGHLDRRLHADVEQARRGPAAERRLHRRHELGRAREQRQPQGSVDGVTDEIEAARHRRATGEHRRGRVEARRDRGARSVEPVDARQRVEHVVTERGFLRRRDRSLVVTLRRDGQDGQLVEGLEVGRALDRREPAQIDGVAGVLVELHADQAARGHRGAHRLAEQAQEGEPLPLGHQVGAVEQRVGEPGEQLDERAPGIARTRVGVLGRVRRDARERLVDEVLERSIVERGRTDGHG
jgi:hypothetical protein